MSFLVLTPPKTGSAVLAFCDTIVAALSARGHAAARISLEKVELKRFCLALAETAEPRSMPPEILAAYGQFTALSPSTLIVAAEPGDADRVAAHLAPVMPRLLAAYLVMPDTPNTFGLKNTARTKRFVLGANEAERAADILRSEMMNLSRIPPETIDPASAATRTLAETVVRTRPFADHVPPRVQCRGAVESLAEGEILQDDTLWIKGWIDWDEKRFSRLILRISDREWRLDIGGFRHDVFDAGAADAPTGFSAQVDLGHVTCQGALSLWIEDRAGLRREWQKRSFWISREGPLQSRTPLIRGGARLAEGRITCDPVCDGATLARVTAWQDGHLLAAGVAPANGGGVVLNVAQMLSGPGLIHLHAVFDEYPPVCWAVLDPLTGLAPTATRFTATVLAPHDRFDAETMPKRIALPKEALRLLLDGKPVGMRHPASQSTPSPIALEGCAGLATLEAVGIGDARQTIRIFRLRRQATQTGGLPAFVMPKAALPAPGAKDPGAKTRVVLIRQNCAPTDELYVLAGLDALSERYDIDLRIVELANDTMGRVDRDALLCDGAFVIVSRYLTDSWIKTLASLQPRLAGIFYLMDDDVTLAENDTDMPSGYRQRMIGVAHAEFQALLHLCTRFIVTSDFLADRFASDKTDLLTPPYIRPCDSFTHLDDTAEIRIEYHGTQVHRADLDSVAAALVQIHKAYPHVRIRTYMGRFAPPSLRGLDRVDIVPDLPWDEYRTAVAASRAHIALAPMLGTPYNRAKSFVKIMDIARLGAVGLYSRVAPFEGVVSHGENGFLLENDALVWRHALEWLIQNPEEIRRMALAGQDLARGLSDANHPATYWERHLFDTAPEARAATAETAV